MITIKNKGFTLIELMITVAIVGILAAVALPAYQDYTIRAQVAEALSLASGQKVAIAEYYSNHGVFPTATQLGFAGSAGKYVAQTEIGENGKITATFGGESNAKLANKLLTLEPEVTSQGNLIWFCVGTVDTKYVPTSCEGMIYHSDGSVTQNNGTRLYTNGSLGLSSAQLSKYKDVKFKNSINGVESATISSLLKSYNDNLAIYKAPNAPAASGRSLVYVMEVFNQIKNKMTDDGISIRDFPIIPEAFVAKSGDNQNYTEYLQRLRDSNTSATYKP